jgi:hypothetical protein
MGLGDRRIREDLGWMSWLLAWVSPDFAEAEEQQSRWELSGSIVRHRKPEAP